MLLKLNQLLVKQDDIIYIINSFFSYSIYLLLHEKNELEVC